VGSIRSVCVPFRSVPTSVSFKRPQASAASSKPGQVDLALGFHTSAAELQSYLTLVLSALLEVESPREQCCVIPQNVQERTTQGAGGRG
jgi:hypothetical protein